MAKNTNKDLRNAIIYSIYVRNYGKEGKLTEVTADLDRIKDLGTDYIWLMPIHPIGVKNKKGDLGCPYANKDYRAINPEYGTLDDFKTLLAKTHEMGMKMMLDVVYNHCSPDSWLAENYPEYIFKKNGKFANKVGDWSDVVDLDYSNNALWDYQIESLKYWSNLGVDGFRCDVASLVPLEFWIKARAEVAKINPDTVWLAESVEPHFIREMRGEGFAAHSDCELYEAFDLEYDYDLCEEFLNYFEGKGNLKEYVEKLKLQDGIYPENYLKIRYLENHDRARAKKLIPDDTKLNIWTAFIYFQKGTTLLYNGQETKNTVIPDLFDIDKINWDGLDSEFIIYLKILSKFKKLDILREGYYSIELDEKTNTIIAAYKCSHKKLIGVFNVENKKGKLEFPESMGICDGISKDILNDSDIIIKENSLELQPNPIIFFQ